MLATSLRLVPCALAVLAATASSQHQKPSRPRIPVRVDPRVELMSVIFRLAGNPEYNRGRLDSYTGAVDAHFDRFRNHEAVQAARDLRRTRGVSFDAVMNMAVHVKDARTLREAVPFEPRPASLEKRWTVSGARGFLKHARRFAKESKFQAFFKKHKRLYATAVERMQKVLDRHARIGWFDEFFGARPQARFELALGMLNGPCNYAVRLYHKGGREDLHCVLGVRKTDREGQPEFDNTMLPTVVHEFCHSYCNPLVDKYEARLRPAGLKIFPHVREILKKQAYGSWQTMMYESLVRACVVRYRLENEGRAAARLEISAQLGRGFKWTGELSSLLGRYEEHRKEHPTLDTFMPEVVKFFADYADRFEARVAKAPRVIRMTPANGARDVDPGISELKITFDRPMRDRCWAFVGGGPHYPETTGKPSYDERRTTITLPVKLKENWSYELWLNRGRFSSFQSNEGVKLEPVRVTFRTGARRR